MNNALKYGLAEMTLRFRQRLTAHLYSQYMRGNTFYLMSVTQTHLLFRLCRCLTHGVALSLLALVACVTPTFMARLGPCWPHPLLHFHLCCEGVVGLRR